MLGLLVEDEGVAARALELLGARATVRRALGPSTSTISVSGTWADDRIELSAGVGGDLQTGYVRGAIGQHPSTSRPRPTAPFPSGRSASPASGRTARLGRPYCLRRARRGRRAMSPSLVGRCRCSRSGVRRRLLLGRRRLPRRRARSISTPGCRYHFPGLNPPARTRG
ncbi:MAG: hypothetical protein ACRDWW_01245 [Acidimicrobiales bacterium]